MILEARSQNACSLPCSPRSGLTSPRRPGQEEAQLGRVGRPQEERKLPTRSLAASAAGRTGTIQGWLQPYGKWEARASQPRPSRIPHSKNL